MNASYRPPGAGGGPQNLKLAPPEQDASNILVALDGDCPLVGTISFSPGANPYAGLTIDCGLRAAIVDLTGRIGGGRVTGVTENVIPDPALENYDLEIYSSKLATPFPMPPVGHLIFDGINTCTTLSSNKKLPFSLTVAASSFTTFSFGVDSFFADPATIGAGSIDWNLSDQPFTQSSLNAVVAKADAETASAIVFNLNFTGTGYVEPSDPAQPAQFRINITSDGASLAVAPGDPAKWLTFSPDIGVYFVVDGNGDDPGAAALMIPVNATPADTAQDIISSIQSAASGNGYDLAIDPDDGDILIATSTTPGVEAGPACDAPGIGFDTIYLGFAGGSSAAVARIIARGGTVVY